MEHVTETMIGKAPVRFEAYIREEGPFFAAAIHINQAEFMFAEFLNERERKYGQSPYDAIADLIPDGYAIDSWQQADGRFNDFFLVSGRIVDSKWGPGSGMTPDQVCEWIDDQ